MDGMTQAEQAIIDMHRGGMAVPAIARAGCFRREYVRDVIVGWWADSKARADERASRRGEASDERA